ncbi:unnamed protein product [Ilex paraguariensis]|uniref:Uncharacterized protein n=1 Tax=Ilex paraguariensis TaxID=185542 RepID=A0ABC8R297_9AQUA
MSIKEGETQAPTVIEEGGACIDRVPRTGAQPNSSEPRGAVGHRDMNGARAMAGGDLVNQDDEEGAQMGEVMPVKTTQEKGGRQRHAHIAMGASKLRAPGAFLADHGKSAEAEAQIREGETHQVDAKGHAPPWAPCTGALMKGVYDEVSWVTALTTGCRSCWTPLVLGKADLATSIDGETPLVLGEEIAEHD